MMKLYLFLLIGVAVLVETTSAHNSRELSSPNDIPNNEKDTEVKRPKNFDDLSDVTTSRPKERLCKGSVERIIEKCKARINYDKCIYRCRKAISKAAFESLIQEPSTTTYQADLI